MAIQAAVGRFGKKPSLSQKRLYPSLQLSYFRVLLATGKRSPGLKSSFPMDETLIQTIQQELETKRPPIQKLAHASLGRRKMQILKVPSAGIGQAWEFAYDEENGWTLSRSEAQFAGPFRPELSGYTPLRVPGDALKGLHEKIAGIAIPLFITVEDASVSEGFFYELAISGGLQQEIRVSWWNNTIEGGWGEFVSYVEEVILFLESLPVDVRLEKWWEKVEAH